VYGFISFVATNIVTGVILNAKNLDLTIVTANIRLFLVFALFAIYTLPLVFNRNPHAPIWEGAKYVFAMYLAHFIAEETGSVWVRYGGAAYCVTMAMWIAAYWKEFRVPLTATEVSADIKSDDGKKSQ
jgi:hypothetical protein